MRREFSSLRSYLFMQTSGLDAEVAAEAKYPLQVVDAAEAGLGDDQGHLRPR